MASKVGRNDPCPCGSGKKHKRCCLGGDTGQIYQPPKRTPPKILIPDLASYLLGREERDAMRRAGAFNAKLMDQVRSMMVPGMSPQKIDDFVYEYTIAHGHVPATKGYEVMGRKYPASCCISPNHVVCHGLPSSMRALDNGDIVNVDLTTIVDGWHGDSSETFLIGEVPDVAREVTQAAFDAMWAAIDRLKPNCRVSEIGKAIVDKAMRAGFSVVESFTGHGIGREFHSVLAIPHYVTPPSMLTKLPPGITFTIEPMINVGLGDVVIEADGFSAGTVDRSLSAQFEHTILMTEHGPEVLTLTSGGPVRGHRF